MSILTAQLTGIVVFAHGDPPHRVDVLRRADVDCVVIEENQDVRQVKFYTVHNRQTMIRVDLAATEHPGNGYIDGEARRNARDAQARSIMMSVVAEDEDVVWTYNNRRWLRVPDKKVT